MFKKAVVSTKSIFLSIICILLSVAGYAVGGTVTASANGNWSAAGTWQNVNINRTGTISYSTASTIVTGSGTSFLTELTVGSVIQRQTGAAIGTVASIQSNTQVTLVANAAATISNTTYRTADGPPSPDDAIIINNARTVTVDRNASCASITLSGGNNITALTISSSFQLSVTGGITFGAGTGNGDNKTITVNGTLSVGGDVTMVQTGGDNRNNEIDIATTGVTTISGDLIMPSSSIRNFITLTGNAVINIAGNVNNGAGAEGGGFPSPSSTSIVNLNGTVAQTVFLNGAASTFGIVKTNNNSGVTLGSAITVTTLTIGDITPTSIFDDGGFQVTSTGTLNLTSGILRLGSTTSGTNFPGFATTNIASGTTVVYQSNQGQTIVADDYANLTSTGSGSRTLASSETIGISGIFTPGANSYTITGSTVNFNGSGAQDVVGFSYNNLNTATGGTKTLTGTVNVASVLTVGSSTTLDLGSQTLNLTGSGTPLVVNGTFTPSTSTVNYSNAASTNITATNYYHLNTSGGARVFASGTVGVAGSFTPGSGGFTVTGNTINFNGSGAQDIPAFSYNNLSTATGGTKTLTGTVNVASVLTVGSSTTLDLSSQTLNLTGNGTPLVVSGTFTSSTSTVNYSNAASTNITAASYNNLNTTGGARVFPAATVGIAGTFTPGSGSFTVTNNTIDFNGSGSQSIPAFNYNNLTSSNSGARTLANSGTVGIAGTFTPGTNAYTVTGSTIDYNGSASQTIVAFNYNNLTSSSTGTRTLASSGAIGIAGTFTPGSNSYTVTGSTINFNGSGAQNIPAFSFNNLGTATSGTKTLTGTVSVASVLTVGASSTLDLSSQTLNLTGTGTPLVVSGTFTASTSTVNYSNAASTNITATNYNNLNTSGGARVFPSGTVGISGTFTPGSGSFTVTDNTIDFNGSGSQTIPAFNYQNLTSSSTGSRTLANSGTIGIAGTFTPGSNVYTVTGSTINYNGAAGQTIAGFNYRNLTISNTGSNSASGAIAVALNFSMANAATVLDMVTHDLSVGGGVSLSGTIKTQSTSVTPLPSGVSWGGTIEYNNTAGGQKIMIGTYTNLKNSNTSGTNTAEGAITVNGQLTVAAGGTMDMSTFALGGTLTTTGSGTIKTQNSTAAPLPAGVTWTPAMEYSRSGTQSVVAGTYSTLTISGSSSKTMNGSVTVTAGLNLTAGALGVSTQVLTIQTNNISRTSGTISASAGTLVFDFNGAITIPSSLFNAVNNMTLSSGVIVSLPATAVTIAGTLNLSSGKLVMGSGTTLALGGTVSNMSAVNCIVSNTATNTVLQFAAGSGTSNMGTIYFDQTTPGTSNTVPTLTFTRTSITDTVAFGNTIRIKTLLTPTAGTVVSNGNVVIGSDANGTGKIYPDINAANFRFSGDVKVERYAKSKVQRRFLLISSPVDLVTVRNAWQDDIFITGAGTGGTPCGAGTGNGGATDRYNSNGFDATIANVVSAYRYSESSGGWVALSNTSYQLEKGKGYRILFRGPRGTNDANCSTYLTTQSPPAPSEATLNVSGTLITGDFNVNVDGPTGGNTYGYTLLGNPYAGELDFGKFVATNPTAISPAYWIYDPNGTNATTSSTTYLTYTTSGGGELAGYYHSDPSGNPANYQSPAHIASGQAFFVQANTSGQVLFKESDKSNQTQAGLFKTNAITSKIRIHFRLADDTPLDNVVVRFSDDPTVSLAVSNYWDVVSFNSGTYFSSMKGTRSFAIQTRPLNFLNDTVQLKFASSATGNYKLVFTNYADFTEAAQIILIDQFTGTQTDVKANPLYTFSITSNSASQGTRFKLVFRSMTSVMPLSYLNISATQKAQGVEVAWKVAFEQGVARYQVERSEDGSNFSVIGSVESKGNSNTAVSYIYMDSKPVSGTVFYRIKSVETAGGKYSPIVKLNAAKSSPVFSIYPNPVKDKLQISVQHNPAFEKATITVRNSQGKTIMQSAHVAVNGYLIDVSAFSSGMYILRLTNTAGETLFQKFIKY